ncbi:MAG: leucine-rich repeat protein, partial [Holosporales bacterium]|nr:leucine-rich repeat protein [Holosporales bacterium]
MVKQFLERLLIFLEFTAFVSIPLNTTNIDQDIITSTADALAQIYATFKNTIENYVQVEDYLSKSSLTTFKNTETAQNKKWYITELQNLLFDRLIRFYESGGSSAEKKLREIIKNLTESIFISNVKMINLNNIVKMLDTESNDLNIENVEENAEILKTQIDNLGTKINELNTSIVESNRKIDYLEEVITGLNPYNNINNLDLNAKTTRLNTNISALELNINTKINILNTEKDNLNTEKNDLNTTINNLNETIEQLRNQELITTSLFPEFFILEKEEKKIVGYSASIDETPNTKILAKIENYFPGAIKIIAPLFLEDWIKHSFKRANITMFFDQNLAIDASISECIKNIEVTLSETIQTIDSDLFEDIENLILSIPFRSPLNYPEISEGAFENTNLILRIAKEYTSIDEILEKYPMAKGLILSSPTEIGRIYGSIEKIFLEDDTIPSYAYNAKDQFENFWNTQENYLDSPIQLFTQSITLDNVKNLLTHFPNTKEIRLPTSITSIDDDAFKDYMNLTSIVIPDSVTSIGANAFYGCSKLASVIIPNSVTSIGANAFYGCLKLKSIVIPNSVTSIKAGAFSGANLKSAIIPDSITSIEQGIFDSNPNLKSLAILGPITVLPQTLFYDCSSLSSITIPDSITSITNGSTNFYYNTPSLNTINILCYGETPNVSGLLNTLKHNPNFPTNQIMDLKVLLSDKVVNLQKDAGTLIDYINSILAINSSSNEVIAVIFTKGRTASFTLDLSNTDLTSTEGISIAGNLPWKITGIPLVPPILKEGGELEDLIYELQTQIEDLTTEKENLEVESEKLENQIEDLTTENKDLTTENTNLARRVATLTAANTNLSGQVFTLTTEKDNLIEENTILEEKFTDLEDKVSTIATQVSARTTGLIDLVGTATTGLTGRVGTLETQVSATNTGLIAVVGATNTAGLRRKVGDLETSVGTSDSDGLRKKVIDLETSVGVTVSTGLRKDVADLIAAGLITRVGTLETQVSAATTGLITKVSTLETQVSAANTGLIAIVGATVSTGLRKDVADLKTSVGTSVNNGLRKDVAELIAAGLITKVGTLETQVSAETTGLIARVSSLEGIVDFLATSENPLTGDVSAIAGRVNTLESNVGTIATAGLRGDVATLKTQVSATTTGLIDLVGTATTGLRGKVTSLE